MDKVKLLVLLSSILTICCGIALILYGFDVIVLSKPLRIIIALCLCGNAVVNVFNYRNILKQQKK